MTTVKELREWLDEFAYIDDVEVRITWESTLQDIERKNLYFSKDGVLLIDADGNSYKKEFESGTMNAKSPN